MQRFWIWFLNIGGNEVKKSFTKKYIEEQIDSIKKMCVYTDVRKVTVTNENYKSMAKYFNINLDDNKKEGRFNIRVSCISELTGDTEKYNVIIERNINFR